MDDHQSLQISNDNSANITNHFYLPYYFVKESIIKVEVI